MENKKDWVSAKEACKILNRSSAALWRYYKKGMIKKSKAQQSNFFDEFLKEDGIFEEVNDMAIKRVIAYQLEQEMKNQNITKTKMAEMMHTSRAVVNRLLSPNNKSLTLDTLQSAINVLGKKLHIAIV
ncbi:MAG: helix-turn-helix domain-containing protein [Campylobacteraceae bacterium]|jgi:predicted XRE-type DNA-binding protein|nr:helix-turn-helix domain-containing protein [Campylobacteraceae bacterium]